MTRYLVANQSKTKTVAVWMTLAMFKQRWMRPKWPGLLGAKLFWESSTMVQIAGFGNDSGCEKLSPWNTRVIFTFVNDPMTADYLTMQGLKVSSFSNGTVSYSISQELCTRFCCALLCCGYAIVHNEFTWSIYPYSSGLLCWHWGNR